MNVWPREFQRHAADPVEVLVLNKGTTKDKMELAHQFVASPSSALRVVVLNYESAWRAPFGDWARNVFWDCVVADESHRAKSPTGKASKWLGKMRFSAKQRLCLSGTPLPHSPLDAFGQFRFLDPTIFGKYYTPFRSRYAVTNPMFPSQVTKWINQDELSAKIASLSFKVGTEVLDLPPVIHETRTVELCPKARRLYDGLEEDLIAGIDDGTVTVSNALVKLLRLQQITSGHAQLDDGPLVKVDDSKEQALTELLEDLKHDEPVVVFCKFRTDLQTVERVTGKLGRRYGELSGQRNDLTPQATMPENVDVMGVQLQAGGVGIDLTRAAYCLYYSAGFSLGNHLQSLARVHRPGQTRTTHYFHLIAERTVDEAVYLALAKRQEVVEAVLKGYRPDNAHVA